MSVPGIQSQYPAVDLGGVVVTAPPKWMQIVEGYHQWVNNPPPGGLPTLTSPESYTKQQIDFITSFLTFGSGVDPTDPDVIVAVISIINKMADEYHKAYYWQQQDPNQSVSNYSDVKAAEHLSNLSRTKFEITNDSVPGGAATYTSVDAQGLPSWTIKINVNDANIGDIYNKYGGPMDGMNYVVSHELGHANIDAYNHAVSVQRALNAGHIDADAAHAFREMFADQYADAMSTIYPPDRGIPTDTGIMPTILSITGTGGSDLLQGSTSPAYVLGFLGTDTISYGLAGAGVVADMTPRSTWSSPSNVYLEIENITGSAYADSIVGNTADNALTGSGGNDSIGGAAGNDTLTGGDGDDFLHGNAGFDQLFGNAGNDTLYGGQDGDTVRGGQGDDMVFGDAAADYIFGDLGNDTVTGAGGADTFYTNNSAGSDVVTDFNRAEGDRVIVEFGSRSVYQQGASTVIDFGSGAKMTLLNTNLSTLDPGWIVG